MELVNFELIKKIFLHINRTEKQAELLPDRKKWNKLISALHTLEDSSNAVKYYVESIYPTDVGGKYLFTYGLFQAMILQQDSAKSINQTLFNKSINFKSEYPHAYSVRELRNDTTGHPTNRKTNRNGYEKFISLAQISLEKYSFYYCKDDYKDAEKNSIIDVNVEEAMALRIIWNVSMVTRTVSGCSLTKCSICCVSPSVKEQEDTAKNTLFGTSSVTSSNLL